MKDSFKYYSFTFYFLILLILFLFRFPTIFYHYADWDEASLMSEAWAMTQGQILYKDMYHIHPIFQFFIFIPFFKLFPNYLAPHAIKIMNILLIFTGSIMIKNLVEKFINDKLTSWLSAILFTFFLSYFKWTYSSHGEFYTLFPILIAANLIFSDKPGKPYKIIITGLFCGIAIFIKQVALFDTIPLFICALLFNKNSNIKKNLSNFIIGLCLATLLAFIYPIINGTVQESIQSMFFHNIKSYTSSPKNIISYLKIPSLFLRTLFLSKIFVQTVFNNYLMYIFGGISLIFSIVFIPLKIFKEKSKESRRYLNLLTISIIWFFSILFGLSIIGRFYSHYFIQVATPASIILVLLIHNIPRKLRIIYISTLLITFLFLGYNHFTVEKQNNNFLPEQVKKAINVATYIKENSNKNDTIFLFKVLDLNLFYLSERLSCNGIYMFYDMDSSHTRDAVAEQKNKDKILKNPPSILITGPLPTNSNSTLNLFFQRLIDHKYTLKKKLYDLDIFFLKKTFKY